MRAVIRGGILSLALWATFPADAGAALGWIEKLSGPGPFRGYQWTLPVICYGAEIGRQAGSSESDTTAGAERLPLRAFPDYDCQKADPKRLRVAIGVDIGRYTTDINPLDYTGDTPDVRAWLVVPYMSVPVGVAFEVGAGAGFIRFTDTARGPDFSSVKFVVQPARLSFKPFAIFSDRTRWEAFQLAMNGMLISESLRPDDFGAIGGALNEPWEFVWQPHLRIDVIKLFFYDRTRTR